VHSSISTSKGKDLFEVFGRDSTFSSAIDKRGIAWKDFLLVCLRLASVPFGVHKVVNGLYAVTTMHVT